jgi:hypothetical protein
MAVDVVPNPHRLKASRLHQARDGRSCFTDHVFFPFSAPGDTVPDVVVQQTDGHLLERIRGRRYLSEDVDAIFVVADHALKTANLALDPAQPHEDLFLVVVVPAHVNLLESAA